MLNKVSRRRFLQVSGGLGALAVVNACAAPVAAPAADDTAGDMAMASITIWSYPRTENDLDIVFKGLLEGFHAEQAGIEASIEVQPWGGRREKLYAAAAAGEAPDIWDATTDTIPAYVEKGVILPLSDRLSSDDLANYGNAELSAASYDGALLMPLFESEVNGPAYSGGLLRELGIDPATAVFDTWDKLHALAETAATKGYYLESLSTFNWGEFITQVHEAGGTVYSADRTVSNFTEDACRNTLQRWVTEFENNWVPIEFAIGSVDEQGGLPNYWLSLEQVTARVEDAACVTHVESQPDLEFFHGHPRTRTGEETPISGVVSGQGWAVTAQSENPDAAIEWVRYMIRPENVGTYCELAGSTPVGTQTKAEFWNPEACVLEHVNRHSGALFSDQDANTLWQESKVVCGPQFQAAILGHATVDEALENIKTEIDALLAEKA